MKNPHGKAPPKSKPPLNTTGKAVVTSDGSKIRNGQRRPYRRSTLEQKQRITEFVADLLVHCARTSEIHDAVRREFDRHWVTANAYIVRAKQYLQQQAAMSADEAKSKGVHVLLRVMQEGKPSERVAAERRLSEIYGYNAPSRSELSGPGGAPLNAVVAPQVSVVIVDNGREVKQVEAGDNGRVVPQIEERKDQA